MIREGPFRGRELFGVIKDRGTENKATSRCLTAHTPTGFFTLVVPLKELKRLVKPPQHLSSELKAGVAS